MENLRKSRNPKRKVIKSSEISREGLHRKQDKSNRNHLSQGEPAILNENKPGPSKKNLQKQKCIKKTADPKPNNLKRKSKTIAGRKVLIYNEGKVYVSSDLKSYEEWQIKNSVVSVSTLSPATLEAYRQVIPRLTEKHSRMQSLGSISKSECCSSEDNNHSGKVKQERRRPLKALKANELEASTGLNSLETFNGLASNSIAKPGPSGLPHMDKQQNIAKDSSTKHENMVFSTILAKEDYENLFRLFNCSPQIPSTSGTKENTSNDLQTSSRYHKNLQKQKYIKKTADMSFDLKSYEEWQIKNSVVLVSPLSPATLEAYGQVTPRLTEKHSSMQSLGSMSKSECCSSEDNNHSGKVKQERRRPLKALKANELEASTGLNSLETSNGLASNSMAKPGPSGLPHMDKQQNIAKDSSTKHENMVFYTILAKEDYENLFRDFNCSPQIPSSSGTKENTSNDRQTSSRYHKNLQKQKYSHKNANPKPNNLKRNSTSRSYFEMIIGNDMETPHISYEQSYDEPLETESEDELHRNPWIPRDDIISREEEIIEIQGDGVRLKYSERTFNFKRPNA